MNLADITTKCYILALIIRDDGERLLLGDGAYEFKDSQQHFIANTYANDVVELQGTDGQMLAGQVRRTAVQTFAGYIGDATFSKQKVEEARRDFLMFFRKKHYYTAVYVFSDGTAIQRDRGYIVNAPSVPELYQRYPEWSVGLNFEDPNYYEYAEDDLGQEIAAHKVELELSTAMSGGLIWDEDGAVSDDLSYVGTEIEGEGKNFQLTDTGTATLKSAELLGNAEQTTYNGKNLLGVPELYYTGANWYNLTEGTTIPAQTTSTTATQTSNGFTINIATAWHGAIFLIPVTAGQTYHIKVNASGTGCRSSLYWLDADKKILRKGGVLNADPLSLEANLAVNSGEVYIALALGSNSVTTLTVTEPQLELGSTATTYEPYVGGTASPNPDYPQAVNTVTGEQTVKIEGKNLFDKDSATQNYRLGSTGDPFADSDYYLSDYISATQNTAYYISGTSGAPESSAVCFYASDKSFISRRAFVDDWYTFTTPANTAFLRFTTLKTNSIDQVQLELGSTATAYEPYHGQSFEINLGKNLFNPFAISTSGITVEEDGTLKLSDNTSAIGYKQTGKTLAQLAPSLKVGDTVYLYLETDWTGKQIYGSHIGNWTNGQSRTITAEMLADNIIVYGGYQTTTTIRVMIKRSLATTYAPYFTPIELAKIGNYQDRIYKTDGKWYIEKQVGKKTFDGTEPWGTSTYGTNSWALSGLLFPFDTSKTQIISNIFRGVSNDDRATSGENIIYSGSANTFYIRNTTLTTLASVRSATSGNYIYYALATPTTTEITNSELVGQLERLKHAHTYADTTNFSITATSPNLPAFLKVVALGDDAIPQGGYVWEDGGTGGATTITVDGVDNAQPIWTVVGPATNPSLTNITTGESIQWTGVVPNGQTLVVNMADMTASLSGANVFEFISGSWITLQAGNNRVSYSATAATGIATLEWNGVVG